jgi:hypothetical protein
MATINTPGNEMSDQWPSLPYDAWKDTCETLHMWLQIVGKVRLKLSPFVNHWWNVPLYVTARGLTTSAIPYKGRTFEVDFDFMEHNLSIVTSSGTAKDLPLISRAVAHFYHEFMDSLRALDIHVNINPLPSEVAHPIRFDEDYTHASYDPEYAHRFWQILLHTDAVFQRYHSSFIGKNSPIHFFWGSFDMAATRFSGRRAPDRPGADRITREAYSHELISCGFWPGNESFPKPAFYVYAVPEPAGFKDANIRPDSAFYNHDIGEFILLYDDVRRSAHPEQALLEFFQSTYEVGATLAHWDRQALERQTEQVH